MREIRLTSLGPLTWCQHRVQNKDASLMPERKIDACICVSNKVMLVENKIKQDRIVKIAFWK